METANKQLAAKECDDTEDNRKTISQLLAQSEDRVPIQRFPLHVCKCNLLPLSNNNGHLFFFVVEIA